MGVAAGAEMSWITLAGLGWGAGEKLGEAAVGWEEDQKGHSDPRVGVWTPALRRIPGPHLD